MLRLFYKVLQLKCIFLIFVDIFKSKKLFFNYRGSRLMSLLIISERKLSVSVSAEISAEMSVSVSVSAVLNSFGIGRHFGLHPCRNFMYVLIDLIRWSNFLNKFFIFLYRFRYRFWYAVSFGIGIGWLLADTEIAKISLSAKILISVVHY